MYDFLFKVDWQQLLVPTHSLLEIFLRGSVMYLSLFLLLRFFLKRQIGVLGIADLLLVVLIADASQNGMAGEYKSIPEGILLVATVILWNVVVVWVGYRFPKLRWLTRPKHICLIRDGQMIKSSMEKEYITDHELLAQLRQQGVQRPENVKEAFLEGDGRVSIIKADPPGQADA
jgi:uncharacterized membrane protein YcaP (DUF421 family)